MGSWMLVFELRISHNISKYGSSAELTHKVLSDALKIASPKLSYYLFHKYEPEQTVGKYDRNDNGNLTIPILKTISYQCITVSR